MAVAYQAGASGLPCGLLRHYAATDLMRVAGRARPDGALSRSPARRSRGAGLNPDVTILHAQQIDAAGNVLIRGIVGAAKEAAMAARCVLVTVEEQVESLRGPP